MFVMTWLPICHLSIKELKVISDWGELSQLLPKSVIGLSVELAFSYFLSADLGLHPARAREREMSRPCCTSTRKQDALLLEQAACCFGFLLRPMCGAGYWSWFGFSCWGEQSLLLLFNRSIQRPGASRGSMFFGEDWLRYKGRWPGSPARAANQAGQTWRMVPRFSQASRAPEKSLVMRQAQVWAGKPGLQAGVQINDAPVWALGWLRWGCSVAQVGIKDKSLSVRANERGQNPAGASPSTFCTKTFTSWSWAGSWARSVLRLCSSCICPKGMCLLNRSLIDPFTVFTSVFSPLSYN